ncbi:RHS repeat-associated core domain-containing protein [Vreelandella sp. GE22]
MQLVAANGETQWQGQPDDWAAVKNIRGNTAQPIRFQGQWQDEESGLYYNRHRYYDPQQGRYVSQDPIGLGGGPNLYGYVTNPMGAVDPLGLNHIQAGVRGALFLEGIRNKAWCVAQHTAFTASRSQLPDILEESIEAAEYSRETGVNQCHEERSYRRIFGEREDVNEGKFSACLEDVKLKYDQRVIEGFENNVERHHSLDQNAKDNIFGCLDMSVGDLHFPKGVIVVA